MNIKNTVSLSLPEAVELLTKISTSLDQNGEFAFDLKGQEVSIEVGEELQAQLSISPEQFSIVFDWKQRQETSTDEEWTKPADQVEDQKQEQEFHEPPKMVKEVNIPERKPQKAQIKSDVQKSEYTPPKRALPKRMKLDTTTLPLEAGYWAPAFTSNPDTEWTRIAIDSELENKKWASDDQITSLSDLTPDSAKPKTKRKRAKKDDDLFSELDNLDQDKRKSRRTTKTRSTQSKEKPPNRTSARPAAKVASIPKPESSSVGSTPTPSKQPSSSQSTPSSQPPKASIPKASIPKPNRKKSIPKPSDDTWKEPSREDNATNDDWVKPSEILKKKSKQSSGQPTPDTSSRSSSIPSPRAQSSTPPSQSKEQNIPVPDADKRDTNARGGKGAEMDDDVMGWKEPSPEENATNDDWVKPSQFLKNKKQNKQKSEEPEDKDAINRPPPTAPDKKKDDKKKGWASWD